MEVRKTSLKVKLKEFESAIEGGHPCNAILKENILPIIRLLAEKVTELENKKPRYT